MSIKNVYPDSNPLLNLDFVNSRRIDPRFQFSRASTGTYVDANGLIKSAAVNEARFDHNPVTGESLGLLVEESRINYRRYSNTFSDASYVKGYFLNTSDGRSLVTPGQADSPLGQGTGWKFGPDPTAAAGSIAGTRLEVITDHIPAGNTKTLSIFAKAGTSGTRLQLHPANAFVNDAIFNLETGVVVSGPGSIQNYGNGWYRCSVVTSVNITSSRNLMIYAICSAYSDFIYIAGCQFEAGSFPTSYIPTTTAAVTRQPDQLVLNNAPINLNGTFYIESSINSLKNQQTIFSADNGTDNFTLKNSDNFIKQQVTNYNSNRYGTIDTNLTRRIISYDSTKNIFMSSSTTEQPYNMNSVSNIPSNLNRISLGCDSLNLGRELNGHIKKFSYYPITLSEIQCSSLVTEKQPLNYISSIAIGGDDVYQININGVNYIVHRFLETGASTFYTPQNLSVEYLVVGGGGGGGYATYAGSGGGGAGGVLTNLGDSPLVLSNTSISVFVGAGGAGGTRTSGNNGQNSSFENIIAIGGGRGGGAGELGPFSYNPTSGGSGGGGFCPVSGVGVAGGSGEFGQGNSGGTGSDAPSRAGGGGGGAGGNGQNGSGNQAGNGGIGVISTITGSSVYYGGGGGGGDNAHPGGTGGLGGGGNGAGTSTNATSGANGLGGGGGGASDGNNAPVLSGFGGSGIVIVRYIV